MNDHLHTFHGCPVCGATVRADLVERHRSWHDGLEEELTTPVDPLQLEPWPAPAPDAADPGFDAR